MSDTFPPDRLNATLPNILTEHAQGVIQHGMLTITVPSEDPLLFYGNDGTECETFIRKLRQTAFAREKLDDSQWMARFASTCFLGKALRWFVGLDSNTKNDWETLEAAMLEMWPSDGGTQDDREENILLPTMRGLSKESTNAPSSSSSEDDPVSSAPRDPSILSRIRLIIEPSSAFETLREDFLTVRESITGYGMVSPYGFYAAGGQSGSTPRPIFLRYSSRSRELWFRTLGKLRVVSMVGANMRPDTADCGLLYPTGERTSFSQETEQVPSGYSCLDSQTSVWDVRNGELVAKWVNEDGCEQELRCIVCPNGLVYMVADPAVFVATYGYGNTAVLLFEVDEEMDQEVW